MTPLAARVAALKRLPESYRLRPLREQFQLLLDMGLAPVDGRMALVPRIILRSTEELVEIWKLPAGAYRNERERESLTYWREFWNILNFHLEACEHDAAAAVIDRAVARVEPFAAQTPVGGSLN